MYIVFVFRYTPNHHIPFNSFICPLIRGRTQEFRAKPSFCYISLQEENILIILEVVFMKVLILYKYLRKAVSLSFLSVNPKKLMDISFDVCKIKCLWMNKKTQENLILKFYLFYFNFWIFYQFLCYNFILRKDILVFRKKNKMSYASP